MHYKLVSFLVCFGFTFTDLSQWYKYSNVCYCNPYVSACCILSLHFTLFSLCIAFVGFNSLTDFAFRWSSRFIRKLRMRRAVAVAVCVAVALLPALLFCELLAQNKTESSNKFWAFGFRVSMTSKSFLGFFSDFCCILRIPRRLPSWRSPKRKELTAIRSPYFIVLLLQSFPLRNLCRQKRGAIVNVVYVENSYDQISALCLPMWAVNDQIFIHPP